MNELMKQLSDILRDTSTFVQGQLPDVANQLLAVGIYNAKMNLILSISIASLLCVICIVVAIGLYYEEKKSGDKEGSYFGPIFIGFVIAIIGAIVATNYYRDLKKIEIAPKVYILEQAKKMSCERGG